jgi:DNA-binding XRE family transcriptional regulator
MTVKCVLLFGGNVGEQPAARSWHILGVSVTITAAGAAAPLVALAEVRASAANGEAKRIRERHRLTQQEIADAIGVSPSAISRWEAGDRLPRGQAAKQYAAVLRTLEAVPLAEPKKKAARPSPRAARNANQ